MPSTVLKQVNDKTYWEKRYHDDHTGWDIGAVSPPLKAYIDGLTDKTIRIFIPGAGNAYEAVYLLEKGFKNVTILDFAENLIAGLRKRLQRFDPGDYRLVCSDFFEFHGSFDLILEQTFFCAIDPARRGEYASKMYELLKSSGKLAGVLFNRDFIAGPPFGGSTREYFQLFSKYFPDVQIAPCYNSIKPRQGSEVFIIATK